MTSYRYDFEKPLADLHQRLETLKQGEADPSAVKALETELEQQKRRVYGAMTRWQRVQLARHPQRPYALDYIRQLAPDFIQLHGDRLFGDDKALIGGVGTIEGQSCLFLGHQKGRDTKENLLRNFGSAHPEGYRKAMRLMEMAEKFGMPIVIFVDTPGAYPGVEAEERGQAHSIAYNIREMARLRTPIWISIIGEGGSGGALGIGVGDWIAMMENAYYSVISPEGCAAILWRDRAKAPDAAEALKITSKDLMGFGMIDEIIEEPLGGAHWDPKVVGERVRASILRFWKYCETLPIDALLERRYDRIRQIGEFTTKQPAEAKPEA